MTRSQAKFLKSSDKFQYETPSVAVDVVIYTVFNGVLHVLTITREEHPFQGMWSLVGGYVDIHKDSDIVATARRKLEEKTGVKTPYLEQLMTVGDNQRDPRGWTISTVYFALLPFKDIKFKNDSQTSKIEWTPIINGKVKKKLAFDHAKILSLAIERLRGKVLYTSLPFYLLEVEFTLREAQDVYEIILGRKIDPKSFRRRFLVPEILQESGGSKISGKRPAKLYRLTPNQHTHFFVRTLEGSI